MSLKDITYVNKASTYGSGSNSRSVNHSLQAGYKRIVLIGVTMRRGTGDIGSATVRYGGVTCTLGKHAEWSDGANERRISSIYYILEDDLPADGSNAVSVVVANSSDIAIWACQFSNVEQGEPFWTGAMGAANKVQLKINASTSRSTDLIYAVTAAPDSTTGYGGGQVLVGEWSYIVKHRCTYDLDPGVPTDLQVLDTQGGGPMAAVVFRKAVTPVASRVYVID